MDKGDRWEGLRNGSGLSSVSRTKCDPVSEVILQLVVALLAIRRPSELHVSILWGWAHKIFI